MALSAAGDAGGQHKIGYFGFSHGPAGKGLALSYSAPV